MTSTDTRIAPSARHVLALVAGALLVLALLVPTARAASPDELSPPEPGASASIAGGYLPHPSQWPWMTAILDASKAGSDYAKQFCGGTLVAPQLVVTAAHCVTDNSGAIDMPASRLQVMLGKRQLSAPGGEHIAVSRVTVHQSYGYPLRWSHDVAMLHLAQPSSMTPALLLDPSVTINQGLLVTTMGWGMTVGKTPSSAADSLKAADFAVWGDDWCRTGGSGSFASDYDAAAMICAGFSDTADSTCGGDSGGPMMTRDSLGRWLLLGVTSWGSTACNGMSNPSVFAWVQNRSISQFILSGGAGSNRISLASQSPIRPGQPGISNLRVSGVRLDAALKRPVVGRGSKVRVRVSAGAAGTLHATVSRRGRSLGSVRVRVGHGRGVVGVPTRVRGRALGRGAYQLTLRLVARGGGSSETVRLGFRVR